MELVFYDIETTVPPGGINIIEFGAIVLDKTGFYEKERFSTLIESNKISARSIDCNGITAEMVKNAPTFMDVAEDIFNILHNRIWIGHNILRFDNPVIVKHFEEIGQPAPEPIDVIDTLPLLRKTFGRRAGNLKMESLGKYFGLGQEQHRAIEDCQMTIEVLKKCSMSLFLEENTGYDAMVNSIENITTDKNTDKLDTIIKAIEKNESLWISYDGGTNPLVPRQIRPVRFDDGTGKLTAFCHQSQSNKYFFRKKIAEIKEECWEI